MRFNFITLFISLATISGFAQEKESEKINMPFDEETKKYTYNEVIEVPGVSAEQMYKLAKDWCKKKYTDDNFSIDEVNVELADIGSFPLTTTLGKGLSRIVLTQTILYNAIFSFKEGRCRFQITNIKMSQTSAGTTEERTMEAYYKIVQDAGIGATRRARATLFNEIDSKMKEIIVEVKNALQHGPKKSDWE
ncbi:MAG: DUF4468 domain-containing protein [Cyclobacteriaceae bacterium]|nr:DUF4468 domain-containing protein [Cyclobacteriaceae bacterium]